MGIPDLLKEFLNNGTDPLDASEFQIALSFATRGSPVISYSQFRELKDPVAGMRKNLHK